MPIRIVADDRTAEFTNRYARPYTLRVLVTRVPCVLRLPLTVRSDIVAAFFKRSSHPDLSIRQGQASSYLG